ncbi:MAG: MAC/perforin domain-containing protein [Candidatus Cryptobacteroides sp.]
MNQNNKIRRTHSILMCTLILVAGLISCRKETFNPSVTIPESSNVSSGLECYGYTVPFEIKSDKPWKIDFNDEGMEIAYALPSEGEGDATVKLCILDNLSVMPRTGLMTVVFPDDQSRNYTVQLYQKGVDNEDNFTDGRIGEAAFAVGYGFDITKGISPSAIRLPIMKKEKLREDNMITVAADSKITVEEKLATGSTIRELTQQLEAKMNFNWSGCGFEVEANSTFNQMDYSNEANNYAMAYLDCELERISINADPSFWAEDGYITDDAIRAIEGQHRKYESTDEGFYKLCERYGTHVVIKATLGGRIKMSTKINTTEIKKEYDLTAFAKLAYNGIVDASASVDETYNDHFNENRESIESKMTILGGGKEEGIALAGSIGDDMKDKFDSWRSKLASDPETWTYLGLTDATDVVPIWELIDDEERAKKLETFIKSGQYERMQHRPNYDMGVQVKITMPEFTPGSSSSLIQDVKIGSDAGKTVAIVCNEYIPELNETKRVNVIYPVIQGNIKFNMGYFPGNEIHRPSHISVYDGKVRIQPIPNTTVGEVKEFYLRGVSFSTKQFDNETPVVTAQYLYRNAILPYGKTETDNIYPLVKIGNLIWLRKDYRGVRYPASGKEIPNTIVNELYSKGNYIYCYNTLADYMAPSHPSTPQPMAICPPGWKIPYKSDVEALVANMAKYNKNTMHAYLENGLLGLDISNKYYCYKNSSGHLTFPIGSDLEDGPYMIGLKWDSLWNSDKYTLIFRIGETGEISASYTLKFEDGTEPKVPVRLVHVIE